MAKVWQQEGVKSTTDRNEKKDNEKTIVTITTSFSYEKDSFDETFAATLENFVTSGVRNANNQNVPT